MEEVKWRPIKTAPKKGQFLAYNRRRKTIFQVYRTRGWNGADDWVVEPWSGLMFRTQTWMPKPKAPRSPA